MPRKEKRDQECQYCHRKYTKIGISNHEAACNNVKKWVIQEIQYRLNRLVQDKIGKQRHYDDFDEEF